MDRDSEPLVFVNFTPANTNLQAEQKRMIRSHAMHVFIRESRPSSSPGPSVEVNPQAVRYGYENAEKSELVLRLGEGSMPPPSAGRVDPFNISPVEIHPYMEEALRFGHRYWHSCFLPKIWRQSLRSQFLGPSLLDHASRAENILHAAVSTSLFVMIMRGKSLEESTLRATLYHRGEALRMIRHDISRLVCGEEIRDLQSVFVSVGILLSYEFYTRDAQAYTPHIQALQSLSRRMGGLSSLGTERWWIFDIISCGCTSTDIGPIFDLEELGIAYHHIRFIDFTTLSPDTLSQVVAELHHLRHVADDVVSATLDERPLRLTVFLETRTLIEHCLFSLKPICHGISALFRRALLGYLHQEFRNIDSSAIIWYGLAEHVRADILGMSFDAFAPGQSWLLWTLFICGSLLQPSELRVWFLEAARCVMKQAGVETWEDVKTMIEDVLWPYAQESCVREFWQETLQRNRAFEEVLELQTIGNLD